MTVAPLVMLSVAWLLVPTDRELTIVQLDPWSCMLTMPLEPEECPMWA